MTPDHVNTVIVGGGQAGLAMSAHLSEQRIDHLVIERDRIAERWRTARWDSLVANGPAWHDRFPMLEFEDCDGDGERDVDDEDDRLARRREPRLAAEAGRLGGCLACVGGCGSLYCH